MFRRTVCCHLALVSAAVALLAIQGSLRADEPDQALSKRALALNDITGESAIQGEVRRLTKDPEGSKKLLKTAVAMVSGKDQPFSFTAAHILASVAQNLKDLESARVFYRACVDEANKLGSAQKTISSYNSLLSMLFQLHKEDDARKVILEILELPDDERHRLRPLKYEALQLVAQSYVSAGKVQDALKLADNLIKSRPKDWSAYETKAMVLRRAGRFDEAEKVAANVLDVINDDQQMKPDDKTEARRSVIAPFFQEGKKDAAVRLAQKVVKDAPQDWRAIEFEVAILMEAGRLDQALKEAEKALALVDGDASLEAADKSLARRGLIVAFFRKGKKELALQLAERDAGAHPDDVDAAETRAILLEDAGKQAEAAKVYDRLLEMITKNAELKAEKKAEIRRSAVLSYVRGGQQDKALHVAQKAVEENPTSWDARECEGIVYQEMGRTNEAAKAFEQMLDLIAKDPNLEDKDRTRQTEIGRYMLSGVYVDANNLPKATEILQGLLTEHPESASYNNDLGYIWADHDMHLEEAEKMIRKAIEQDRKDRGRRGAEKGENAAYLDSMGWVLYKKKNYAEAEKYLEKAIQDKKDGQHVEILDHLADVYMALGQKDKAVSTWKQALKLAGKTRRELERKAIVEKKLKDNDK